MKTKNINLHSQRRGAAYCTCGVVKKMISNFINFQKFIFGVIDAPQI